MKWEDAVSLFSEMELLMAVTSDIQWDGERARPIGQRQWNDAWKCAALIDRAVSHLPKPIPGADPEGFVWLTYETGGRRLALELHASLLEAPFRWTTIRDGMPMTFSSHNAKDVIESIRAVFGHTSRARAALSANV